MQLLTNKGKSETRREPVFFLRADYVRFHRRLLIEAIDVLIAIIISLALFVIAFIIMESYVDDADFMWMFIVSSTITWFGYFVLLKRYCRTLGYRMCRAKIVSIEGEKPGIASLALRLLFAIFGPFNLLVDLIWATGDDARQTLRDKFARTYVVNESARPAGRGRLVWTNYFIFGVAFTFREVKPIEEEKTP